jgi:hypothetical protein
MKPSEQLKMLMGFEKADELLNFAREILESSKNDSKKCLAKTAGLDPTDTDVKSLQLQVAASIILIMQASKIVESADRVVSAAAEAVQTARDASVNPKRFFQD